jgi:hypothetical protein
LHRHLNQFLAVQTLAALRKFSKLGSLLTSTASSAIVWRGGVSPGPEPPISVNFMPLCSFTEAAVRGGRIIFELAVLTRSFEVFSKHNQTGMKPVA